MATINGKTYYNTPKTIGSYTKDKAGNVVELGLGTDFYNQNMELQNKVAPLLSNPSKRDIPGNLIPQFYSGEISFEDLSSAINGTPTFNPNIGPQINYGQGPQSLTPEQTTALASGQNIGQVANMAGPGAVAGVAPVAPTAPATGGIDLPNLAPGSTGQDVVALQKYLVANGYMTQAQMDTGPGIYGPQTTAAVAAMQKKLNVPTNGYEGYFGPATKSALATVGNSGIGGQSSSNAQMGAISGGLPVTTPVSINPQPVISTDGLKSAPKTSYDIQALIEQNKQMQAKYAAGNAVVQSSKKALDDFQSSVKQFQLNIGEQAIPMNYIVGQDAALIKQASIKEQALVKEYETAVASRDGEAKLDQQMFQNQATIIEMAGKLNDQERNALADIAKIGAYLADTPANNDAIVQLANRSGISPTLALAASKGAREEMLISLAKKKAENNGSVIFSQDEKNTIQAIGATDFPLPVQNALVNAMTPEERTDFMRDYKAASTNMSVDPQQYLEKWAKERDASINAPPDVAMKSTAQAYKDAGWTREQIEAQYTNAGKTVPEDFETALDEVYGAKPGILQTAWDWLTK